MPPSIGLRCSSRECYVNELEETQEALHTCGAATEVSGKLTHHSSVDASQFFCESQSLFDEGPSLFDDVLSQMLDRISSTRNARPRVGLGSTRATRIGKWSKPCCVASKRGNQIREYTVHTSELVPRPGSKLNPWSMIQLAAGKLRRPCELPCDDTGTLLSLVSAEPGPPQDGADSARSSIAEFQRRAAVHCGSANRPEVPGKVRMPSLPRALQHFPALVLAGDQLPLNKVEASHDRQKEFLPHGAPAPVSGPNLPRRRLSDTDAMPPPFRYGPRHPNLFGRGRDGNIPPSGTPDTVPAPEIRIGESLRVPGAKTGNLSAPVRPSRISPPPASSRGRQTPTSKRRVSPHKNKFLGAAALARFGQSSDGPSESLHDVEVKRTGALWKVKPPGTKLNRLQRLDASRKDKTSEVIPSRHRLAAHAMELAEECFIRYQNGSAGVCCEHNLLAALADFGIRARSQPEKIELMKIVAMHGGNGTIGAASFKEFCMIVEESRVRLRTARFPMLFGAFRRIDSEDTGFMDRDQAFRLLAELNLEAADAEEAAAFGAMIDELSPDANGLLPLVEIEHLVQVAREYSESRHRRKEREIQEQHQICDETFTQFRSQLRDLESAFNRLDEDGNGRVEPEEALNLLTEFGLSGLGHHETIRLIEGFIEQLGGEYPDFQWFLRIVDQLRKLEMEKRSADVLALFTYYDKDKSGSLDMPEVCSILCELCLQPRSIREQEGIAELLDELDRDGSGTLDFVELMLMVQRISEKLQQLKRLAENSRAEKELDYSRAQVNELRKAFVTLDFDESGYLSTGEVERALHLMKWRFSHHKLHAILKDIEQDGDVGLSFIEFLEFLRKIEDFKCDAPATAPTAAPTSEEPCASSPARPNMTTARVAPCAGGDREEDAQPRTVADQPRVGRQKCKMSLSVVEARLAPPSKPPKDKNRSSCYNVGQVKSY